jgi:2-phosphosulfolactate phosphatase
MVTARSLARWELEGVTGAVVAIDVLRAFTTAAYAFGAGADAIYLAATVDEAIAFTRAYPGTFAMGEEHGRRPEGFHFSNSPAEVARANLTGRTLVQRTSAGTQGVIAAANATRLWCASLVCATATARAINESGLGTPTYVITGRFQNGPPDAGSDDVACADYIEQTRTGLPVDHAACIDRIVNSGEAVRTLLLGEGHVDPDDIVFATRIDAFKFSMEVTRHPMGLCLRANR